MSLNSQWLVNCTISVTCDWVRGKKWWLGLLCCFVVVGGFSRAVRWSRLVPEEQLECSRRFSGICVYCGHPGLTRILWREQNPGYLTSSSTAQNTKTLEVW